MNVKRINEALSGMRMALAESSHHFDTKELVIQFSQLPGVKLTSRKRQAGGETFVFDVGGASVWIVTAFKDNKGMEWSDTDEGGGFIEIGVSGAFNPKDSDLVRKWYAVEKKYPQIFDILNSNRKRSDNLKAMNILINFLKKNGLIK